MHYIILYFIYILYIYYTIMHITYLWTLYSTKAKPSRFLKVCTVWQCWKMQRQHRKLGCFAPYGSLGSMPLSCLDGHRHGMSAQRAPSPSRHVCFSIFQRFHMSVLWSPSTRVKVLGHVANLGLCLRCDFGNLELAARRSHETHLHWLCLCDCLLLLIWQVWWSWSRAQWHLGGKSFVSNSY